MNPCTEIEFMYVFRRPQEHILIKTDLQVAFLIFRFSKEKNIFLQEFIKDFEEKNLFFFKIHINELRFKNNRQNVLKPKYVVNGLLKRISITFDDFLTLF